MDEDVQQVLLRHRENLETTVSSLKMKLARCAEEHEHVYEKLMKVREEEPFLHMVGPALLFTASRVHQALVSAGERDADHRDQRAEEGAALTEEHS